MQIKMAGQNAQMRITMGNISNNKVNPRGKNLSGNAKQGSLFGPECVVTISREGRKKSEQEKGRTCVSAVESQTGRLLMREQRQTEENRDEYSRIIDEISELAQSLQKSYQAGEDEETIQKKQDALNKLMDLKKRQEEENEQRLKDAAEGTAGTVEQQEVDRKNRELLMLIKTLEEAKEEQENGGSTAGSGSAAADTEQEEDGAGAQLQESASMLGASAAKRELAARGAIDELKNDGYDKLAQVREIMGEISSELELAREAAGKEGLSADERRKLVTEHAAAAQATLVGSYGDMVELRRKGLQEIKDSRELDLRHIQINPLDGVKQAQQTIMEAGAQAALQEAAAGVLDEDSKELEKEVREAIDNRDDTAADSTAQEEMQEIIREKAEEKETEKEAEKEAESKAEKEEKNEKITNFIN